MRRRARAPAVRNWHLAGGGKKALSASNQLSATFIHLTASAQQRRALELSDELVGGCLQQTQAPNLRGPRGAVGH
jgi:hypothetical protein